MLCPKSPHSSNPVDAEWAHQCYLLSWCNKLLVVNRLGQLLTLATLAVGRYIRLPAQVGKRRRGATSLPSVLTHAGMLSGVEIVQRFLEAISMATLRLRQRLEPISDFVKTFVASSLSHARVHVGVLVSLACY